MKKIIETPVTAGAENSAENRILDKRGFAQRWMISVRTVDNCLRDGLPCMKIGSRIVRIDAFEGDEWMRQKFGTRRAA
jgi:hypothetical protein